MGLGDVFVYWAVLSLAVKFLKGVDHLSADDLVISLVFGYHPGLQLPQLLLCLVLLSLQLQQLRRDELHDLLTLTDLGATTVLTHLRNPFPRLLVFLTLVKHL